MEIPSLCLPKKKNTSWSSARTTSPPLVWTTRSSPPTSLWCGRTRWPPCCLWSCAIGRRRGESGIQVGNRVSFCVWPWEKKVRWSMSPKLFEWEWEIGHHEVVVLVRCGGACYITTFIYLYILGTQLTPVLIGKGHILGGWWSKIEVIQVLGIIYSLTFFMPVLESPKKWLGRMELHLTCSDRYPKGPVRNDRSPHQKVPGLRLASETFKHIWDYFIIVI